MFITRPEILLLSFEYFGVEVEVLPDVGGDVVVGVVIALAQVEDDGHAGGATRRHQVLRQQLLVRVELVCTTLKKTIN